MKTRILRLSMILALALVFTNCKDKASEANVTEAEEAAVSESTSAKYVVNTDESSIHWKGFKPTGTHTGTISLENGVIKMEDGNLQSGTFLIDMNTITVTDMESGDGKEDLEAHLKGTAEGKTDHFFDVKKYPTAAFEITGSEPSEGRTKLAGNLTIKGQKHNITFPVNVSTADNIMTIESEPFSINRTVWGVNYGSKSVFDNLGDKFINDQIELKIVVKAKKA